MKEQTIHYCFYSGLPSPMAYMEAEEENSLAASFSENDINRIIEMAWEDRTPFDAIKIQFGLNENEVKALDLLRNWDTLLISQS